MATHWIPAEVDTTQDIVEWQDKLNDKERNYIKKILVYFLSADSGVGENAFQKLSRLFPRWEWQLFYMWQGFNETIHSETYKLLMISFITEESERLQAANAIINDPGVSAKAQLVMQWVKDVDKSPHEYIVAAGFMESVFFGGSFSSIGWLKQYKHVMEKGLVFSNDKISADEGLHCEASFHTYHLLKDKLPSWRVYQICCEFVEKEFFFIEQTLQVDLIGMNASSLKQYILFVADITLRYLGYAPIYKVKNPFEWMKNWSLDGLTSFFEMRNVEYHKANILQSARQVDEQQQATHKRQHSDTGNFGAVSQSVPNNGSAGSLENLGQETESGNPIGQSLATGSANCSPCISPMNSPQVGSIVSAHKRGRFTRTDF